MKNYWLVHSKNKKYKGLYKSNACSLITTDLKVETHKERIVETQKPQDSKSDLQHDLF